MAKTTYFALSLIAGILVLINGLVFLALTQFLSGIPGITGFLPLVGTGLGIWGVICGIILMAGGFLINKGDMKKGGIIVLIFSIISLITVSGFLIGAILGIVGGALAIARKE